MSGAADSLYSQDDLFFTVQADVVGAGGGCSCAQLLCPLRRLLGGTQCSCNEYSSREGLLFYMLNLERNVQANVISQQEICLQKPSENLFRDPAAVYIAIQEYKYTS